MNRLKRSIPLLEQGDFSAAMITFDIEHDYACVKTHGLFAGERWRYRVSVLSRILQGMVHEMVDETTYFADIRLYQLKESWKCGRESHRRYKHFILAFHRLLPLL